MDQKFTALPVGKAEVLREGQDVVLMGYGTMVAPIVEAADLLAAEGINVTAINARFAKPLDTELIDSLAADEPIFITAEENVRPGGFGSGVTDHLVDKGYDIRRIINFALPDRFIEHGPRGELLAEAGLSAENFARAAAEMLRSPKALGAIGK